MRLILLIFALLVTYSSLWSQDESEKEQIEKESYEDYQERPYPAANVPASEEAAAFMRLFEESDVGNLRLYSNVDAKLPYGYPFEGEEIPESFYDMFTGEYRELLEDDKSYAYSIYNIKGNTGEHYLMRMPTNKGPNTLVMFDLQGEVMQPVMPLAYAYCSGEYCFQQDAFITDLDGDTDLDVLIKFRRTAADSEEVINKNDLIYLQGDDGTYQMVLDNAIRVDVDRYNMKELEF